MTDAEKEIKRLISYIRSCREANMDCTVTIDKSITHGVLNALEEIQQYRALCPVEELKDLLVVISEAADDVDERGISVGFIHDLFELIKYRKIGTVEECQEAKQIIRKCVNSSKGDWIKIRERLPEDGETVLCTDGENVYLVEYEADLDAGFGDMDGIIAWQLPPEPYRPKKGADE